jgi:ribosomal protein L11 methyltransferase
MAAAALPAAAGRDGAGLASPAAARMIRAMPLHKLRIEAADLQAGRLLSQRLEELASPAALAVTLFEAGAPRFLVEAYYDPAPAMAPIEAALAGVAGLGPPQLEAVPDQNWVALSQALLPPVAAGRFVVHGSHDRARFAVRRLAVEIEAGEAFGTGYNATTALCLAALAELTKRRRFAGVLDLGCGSGVLAIAAARVLPAARVVAVDSDARAAAIAGENARLNRVASRVRVLGAAGFAHPALRGAQRFDLVLANLLPGPLIGLARDMRRAIRPAGVAVLSGVLDHQAREVAAVYCGMGFRLVRRLEDRGWAALVLARRH